MKTKTLQIIPANRGLIKLYAMEDGEDRYTSLLKLNVLCFALLEDESGSRFIHPVSTFDGMLDDLSEESDSGYLGIFEEGDIEGMQRHIDTWEASHNVRRRS